MCVFGGVEQKIKQGVLQSLGRGYPLLGTISLLVQDKRRQTPKGAFEIEGAMTGRSSLRGQFHHLFLQFLPSAGGACHRPHKAPSHSFPQFLSGTPLSES